MELGELICESKGQIRCFIRMIEFVPFVNKFPRNTELYKLMTTKFEEV